MLNCKEVSRLISRSQDQKLSLTESLQLKLHLIACHLCRRYQNRMHFLCRAMTESTQQPDIKLSDETKKRLQASLDEKAIK